MANPYVTANELKGLPTELIKQLNLNKSDILDMRLADIVDELGQASIDKILVQYYLKHDEILERQSLMTRLYRMTMKGMIKNIPKKKGVYGAKDD